MLPAGQYMFLFTYLSLTVSHSVYACNNELIFFLLYTLVLDLLIPATRCIIAVGGSLNMPPRAQTTYVG